MMVWIFKETIYLTHFFERITQGSLHFFERVHKMYTVYGR